MGGHLVQIKATSAWKASAFHQRHAGAGHDGTAWQGGGKSGPHMLLAGGDDVLRSGRCFTMSNPVLAAGSCIPTLPATPTSRRAWCVTCNSRCPHGDVAPHHPSSGLLPAAMAALRCQLPSTPSLPSPRRPHAVPSGGILVFCKEIFPQPQCSRS